jgi:AcrR family transcriptional regulator
MISTLEKARKDPDSMKAKILKVARRVFGEYGFHGTTTRLIAQETGIDISTLHYHWGDKANLYESVILDITDDLKSELAEVEKVIHGLPLAKRMEIAIGMVTDYLFACPEISNLILFRYFGKTRHEAAVDPSTASKPRSEERGKKSRPSVSLGAVRLSNGSGSTLSMPRAEAGGSRRVDFHMPEFVSDIARSMHLSESSKDVPVEAKMKVLAMMNAIYNFISGEEFFRSMLKLEKEDYVSRVKGTLKFILIPAFVSGKRQPEPRDTPVYEDQAGGWLWVNERDH